MSKKPTCCYVKVELDGALNRKLCVISAHHEITRYQMILSLIQQYVAHYHTEVSQHTSLQWFDSKKLPRDIS